MAKKHPMIAVNRIERRINKKPESIDPGQFFEAQSDDEHEELLGLKAARDATADEVKANKPAAKSSKPKAAAPAKEDPKPEETPEDESSDDTGSSDDQDDMLD